MTDLLSVEEQATVTLGHPAASPYHHHRQRASRRSSSEVDYEIAHHLIQQSQSRGDGNGTSMVGSNEERRPSVDFIVGPTSPKEDYRPVSHNFQQSQEVRRTPSQERPPESHYAPISIPSATGQLCR